MLERRKIRMIRPNSEAQYGFLVDSDKDKSKLHELLFAGGFGCGKSYCGLGKIVRHVAHPQTDAILARSNAADCWRTTAQLLLYGDAVTAPLLPPSVIKSVNKIESSITLKNHSKIWVYGLDDIHKVRSRSAACALLDESTSATEEGWEELKRRCRIPHPLGNWCGALCNTTDENSWCAMRWKIPERGRKAYIGKTLENRANLSQGYINDVLETPEEERKYIFDGIWRPAKGDVFYAFHGGREVDEKSIDFETFFVSQDYGGGAGNAAMLQCGLDRHDHLFIMEEWGGERQTHDTVHDQMDLWQEEKGDDKVVYDPANAALALEMEDRGWECVKPEKSIDTGIAVVNSMFARGKLTVSDKCVKLCSDLTSAKYSALGKIKKVKGWDYLDALRYAAMEVRNAARWSIPA